MIPYVDILPLDVRGHLKGRDKRLSISRFAKGRSNKIFLIEVFRFYTRLTHIDFCLLILAGDT
jgi:hypothetical protein